MEILIAVIIALCGIAVGYLIAMQRSIPYKEKAAVLASQLEETKKSHEDQLNVLEKTFEDTIVREQMRHREALEAMQGRFDETVAKIKAELENTTSEMLKNRQEEFETSSRESVSRILEPLNQNLKQMRDAVNENTSRNLKLGGELTNNLQLVMQHSDLARQSAEKLAEALRGGGKVQGDWGETVLTELLESQGLKEGIHFDTQVTLADEKGNSIISDVSGSLMRPDVILHLDRNREVIVDAKVSLSAFIDYVNAKTEEKRTLALKKHIESIEKHVKELAKKDYSSYIIPPKRNVNYVIMFVPTSAALYVATSEKSDLWRKAMEQGVYIADEQTLYAALRIIDMTWRQIAQAENHEKVFKLANEMLDRVTVFMEKFTAVGSKLNDAQKVYEDAYSKLKDSGTSIPVTCRKLVKMGAKSNKKPKGVDPYLLGLGSFTDDEAQEYPILTE